MFSFYFLFLCMFASNVAATTGHYGIHGYRDSLTTGWHKLSRAEPQSTLPMQIALAQQNLDSAEQLLMNISNPTSLQFSQHLTAKEVARRFAPSVQAVKEVMVWLNESGISRSRITRSHSGGWLYFNATISEAERLLRTEYHIYNHSATGEVQAACETYNIPTTLQKHIDFVMPTIHVRNTLQPHHPVGSRFSSRRSHFHKRIKNLREIPRTTAAAASAVMSTSTNPCWEYTQLDCLRALYNIPTSNISHPNNSFGIFEVAWLSWLPTDLDSFFGIFMPSMVGRRPVMDSIDGGYFQNTYQLFPFNGEPDLDFEYAMSLVSPQNVTNYQVGDEFIEGYINNLLAALDKSYCGSLDPSIDPIYPDPTPGGYNSSDCGNHKISNVISISYATDEVGYPSVYEERQCLEFLKLGLQGVSVIVASADFGVAGQANQCIDPTTRQDNSSTGYFSPTFPSTCPYVTSVGGTQLPVNSSVSDPETTLHEDLPAGLVSSGGGFSNVFPPPFYQSRTVGDYLYNQRSSLSSISARFNSSGRGFPDVAANAADYLTFVDGNLITVSGTSASTPVFASIITKINDARLTAMKRPVGFINPVLYTHPDVMNDIVTGSNYGCGGKGFDAVKGWDPVTGLGTPDYNRLLDLYLELP